jgi:hypothetical protein
MYVRSSLDLKKNLRFRLWCLTTLSTIFQLYRGINFSSLESFYKGSSLIEIGEFIWMSVYWSRFLPEMYFVYYISYHGYYLVGL